MDGRVQRRMEERDLRRTIPSENSFREPHQAWHGLNNPSIRVTPVEMIEAAEHKVDSVSLRMGRRGKKGENDSFQQHCSREGLTVRVQLSADNVAGKG